VPLSTIGPESEYLFEKEVKKVADRLDPTLLPWSREGTEGVGTFLKSCQGTVERIRDALERPGCDFGIRLDEGLLAEVTGVERALFAGRLLTLDGLYEIRQGRLKTAIKDFEQLLHLALGLSRELHLVPRIAAARVREDAFLLLANICSDPTIDTRQLKRLYRSVLDTLGNWPDDSLMWQGERAQGLHAYEMVRSGFLLSLLTKEQHKHVLAKGKNEFSRSIVSHVDDDEQFYLRSMEIIIATCSDPYYKRVPKVNKVFIDLERFNRESGPVWMATDMLLVNVENGLYWQGHDRALAEGWLLALGVACDAITNHKRTNPLTGKPYELTVGEKNVVVWGVSDENEGGWQTAEPLLVPRLTQIAQRALRLR
jgi:hypothetical protein